MEYAKVNTRSDEESKKIPTTSGQVKLAKIIVNDLKRIGVANIVYDQNDGYVVASLSANIKENIDTIGFIAHLDTANFKSENIKPIVHRNYDGNDVVLNAGKKITMSLDEFPNLKNYTGQTLITSDGTTLLGVDDKAGIIEIITAFKYLIAHPDIKHGEIFAAFGPDEEIGYGAKRFDIRKFKASFAYTLDNGLPGQIEDETFNAAQAKIRVKGTSVHPGDAFGTMINATTIANKIITALPENEVPEKSKGRDGFFLVTESNTTVSEAYLNIIIRDFDDKKFLMKKVLLKDIVDKINQKFDYERVTLEMQDQYHNIKTDINKTPYIIDLVKRAYTKLGLKTTVHPFRGGTDGNAITEKGIPTPNLFNGGENFHGQYEFITVEAMKLTANMVVEIIKEHVIYSNE
ncbi:MAG: peptidase T [Liquorilactobacillus mali]|uniref:peptidase T n=1 Tax=Liquorilactobacillus mali TaxID=1618 RepID=UPI0039E7EDBC